MMRAIGVVARAIRPFTEQRRMQCEGPVERSRIWIDQQFRRIEAMSVTRIVRPGCSQSVTLPWRDVRDETMEYVAVPLRQRDTLLLRAARRVEETQLDRRRVRRKYGDVDAPGNERNAKRFGAT